MAPSTFDSVVNTVKSSLSAAFTDQLTLLYICIGLGAAAVALQLLHLCVTCCCSKGK